MKKENKALSPDWFLHDNLNDITHSTNKVTLGSNLEKFLTITRMMRDDKQFCLQLQLPRKSYLERHKIHENDHKTPNYNFESTHPNHTPDMDSSQIVRDHYNNWDTRTPNPIIHPSNMRLYHESHGNALTVQSTRHHQYEVMANHHQLYNGITAHCQDTTYVPQFGTPIDTGIQLQPSWYPGNQNPIASSSSTYAQTSLYEDWNRHCASRPHFSVGPTDMLPFANSSLSPTQDISQYQDHRSPPQELNFSSNNNNVDSNITDLTHSVSPVSCDGMSSSDSRDMIHHHSPEQMQHSLIRGPVELNQFDCIKKNSYQMQCNGGRTRTKDKYRVVYSEVQRIELEKEFYRSRYITMKRKTELAQLFGLSERQVKIWFQNRRAKERKQVKKQEQELVRNERESDFVNQHHQMQMNTVNGSWQ